MGKLALILGSLFVSGITQNCIFGLPVNEKFLQDTLKNQSFDRNISTIILFNPKQEFSLPVIELGTDNKLELHFDDLTGSPRQFGYTLKHCDADWTESDMEQQEYVSGYGLGSIENKDQSFNTTREFIHYKLVFPAEECMPQLSGNYVIVIFENDDPEKIILSRRFFVTESKSTVSASLKRPPNGKFYDTGQQLQVSVQYNPGEIHDAASDLTTVIMQNNRFDNCLVLTKAFSQSPGNIQYNGADMGIFPGGNEFRSLDLKSMKYESQQISAINFQNPYYHVVLKTDEERASKPYFSNRDLNGNYFINKEKSQNRHTEADYVYVHFAFRLMYMYSNENIYVTGEFCDWKYSEQNRMKLDETDGLYKVTLLMKQGLYDYCYFMKNPETGKTDDTAVEGSYYETENDYDIFVYFKDRFKGCDLLIGYYSIK
ncbi:MAG TPA: DUF5103 domain-containing protein [Bacteroidales bacterium]|nr:DUF5103 domain-containing protein [Bacteroidales bacterium]